MFNMSAQSYIQYFPIIFEPDKLKTNLNILSLSKKKKIRNIRKI